VYTPLALTCSTLHASHLPPFHIIDSILVTLRSKYRTRDSPRRKRSYLISSDFYFAWQARLPSLLWIYGVYTGATGGDDLTRVIRFLSDSSETPPSGFYYVFGIFRHETNLVDSVFFRYEIADWTGKQLCHLPFQTRADVDGTNRSLLFCTLSNPGRREWRLLIGVSHIDLVCRTILSFLGTWQEIKVTNVGSRNHAFIYDIVQPTSAINSNKGTPGSTGCRKINEYPFGR
jgi:hypothetical protein